MTEPELFRAYRVPADHRRILLRDRARRRVDRRIEKLLAYIQAHPASTRFTDSALARLDDLVGDAAFLVNEL